MGDDAAKLTVVDNAELSGYEAELEGRRVGFIAYRRRNDTLVMFHAEVDPEVEGGASPAPWRQLPSTMSGRGTDHRGELPLHRVVPRAPSRVRLDCGPTG